MKRLLLCSLSLLTASLMILACGMSASAVSFVKGDADGDGEVSSLDVTSIQRVLSDIYPDEDGCIAQRGAVTGDTLTLMDATEIQRYLAGFENKYHIGDVCESGETEAPTAGFEFPTRDNQLPIIKN